MKTEQRHAREHWLRIQAEAALGLAGEVEPDMNAVKIAIKDVQVLPLQGLRKDALKEAAIRLVKAELIHREIVRRGGESMTVDQAFDMDTAIKPLRWVTPADFGPWEHIDGSTVRQPIVTDRDRWMRPAEPWIICSQCDCVLYDGDNHKALESYRIRANGDAICSECDDDEGADFHASGQEEV